MKNVKCGWTLLLNLIYFSGTQLSYEYESHLQSKIGSIVKSENSDRRHLSFKLSAKLEITQLWKSEKNESIFSVQVRKMKNSLWFRKKVDNYKYTIFFFQLINLYFQL